MRKSTEATMSRLGPECTRDSMPQASVIVRKWFQLSVICNKEQNV